MRSYAQNFEDVILNRIFPNERQGFYVDIGAMHPVNDSVTNWFYQNGWRGVNVEPNPIAYQEFTKLRDRDVNLQVVVSERKGQVHLKACQDPTAPEFGLSTVHEEPRDAIQSVGMGNYQSIPVSSISLNDLHTEHNVPKNYEFLKIDVEGSEYNILSVADFSQWRPKVVLVEATKPLSREENYQSWEPFLLNQNYRFFYFDGLNRFYLSDDFYEAHKHLAVPPNVFDEFELHRYLVHIEELSEIVQQNDSIVRGLKKSLDAIEMSFSYRLGRWITYPIRKILGR